MNISSIVVHAAPGHAGGVRERVSQLSGVEIHAESEDGRFVVTIESASDSETVSTFEQVQRLDGVLSAAMVYHQFEPDPEREA